MDDKIIKRRENDRKFRENIFQSNVITQTFLPFTRIESDIFCLILSTLEKDCLTYNLEIKQIMKTLNIGRTNYKYIIKGIEGLYEKSLHISTETTTKKIRFLSMIEYDKVLTEGEGYLRIEICLSIVPYLFNLKNNFSVFSLSNYLKLKWTISKKIYQLFSQYKKIGKLQITIEDFQKILGVNYKDTPKFLYSIKKHIDIIQDTTNIENIRIIKVKKGKRIESLVIYFRWMERQLELNYTPTTLQMDIKTTKLYQTLIDDFHQTPTNSKKIVENIPHQDIRHQLKEIKMGYRDGRVKNIGSYTWTLFMKNYNLI